jgi:hypothetical protein
LSNKVRNCRISPMTKVSQTANGPDQASNAMTVSNLFRFLKISSYF